MNKKNPLILVVAGVIIGLYWCQPITRYLKDWVHPQPKKLWFCPPTELVITNQSNPQSFEVTRMNWIVDYHPSQAPEKIGFMQALYKDNNITCYYQWENPQDKSTKLWMMVKLSPSVNDKILPYGSYWNKNLCSAGINACAFEVCVEQH